MSGMSTTCPNCRLQLAVTPSDLRVGQGDVRCGRCHRVFNALASLVENGEGEATPEPAEKATESVVPLGATPPTAGDSQPPPAETAPEEDALPAVPDMPDDVDVVETVGTGTFETIVLEGNGVLQTEEHVDPAMIDQELLQLAEQLEAGKGLRFDEDEPGEDIPRHIVMELSEAREIPADAEPAPYEDVSLLGEPPAAPPVHWAWKAAAGLLALALLLQVMHHNRRSLVTKAWAAPVVAPLYSALGSPLEPDWNLASYAVRQLGGEAPAFARDQIIVRASVQNTATHPQPLPVLRVTLQDRFGNPLATHDVPPQDYLRSTPPARLTPDQRVDAELVLADPGSRAAGFEIDACLPGGDSRLHCAGAQ